MDELARWLLERLARLRRRWPGPTGPTSARLADTDRALDTLEREQREIAARIRLLEIASDLRGEHGRHAHD